jgi:acetyl esterase
MSHDPRWDPQMLAVTAALADAAAAHPPVQIQPPLEPHRAVNDLLGIQAAGPGPAIAHITDHWIPARGRRIQCRLYRPTSDEKLPLLVYLHGGGWVWSSIDTHDRLAREISLISQAAVLSVDYALSPEAKFPHALEECALVVRHLAAHAADWNIDPARIAIGGDSAGGNLAFATALLLRDTSGPALRAILAFYPVCDTDLDTPTYREFSEGYGLTTQKMRECWDAYLGHAADRLNPLAAPLRADLTGLPPTLIQLAELDVLRSEGENLAAKLRAARVPVTCTTYPGLAHGYIRHTARITRAHTALAEAGEWLAKTL